VWLGPGSNKKIIQYKLHGFNAVTIKVVNYSRSWLRKSKKRATKRLRVEGRNRARLKSYTWELWVSSVAHTPLPFSDAEGGKRKQDLGD